MQGLSNLFLFDDKVINKILNMDSFQYLYIQTTLKHSFLHKESTAEVMLLTSLTDETASKTVRSNMLAL